MPWEVQGMALEGSDLQRPSICSRSPASSGRQNSSRRDTLIQLLWSFTAFQQPLRTLSCFTLGHDKPTQISFWKKFTGKALEMYQPSSHSTSLHISKSSEGTHPGLRTWMAGWEMRKQNTCEAQSAAAKWQLQMLPKCRLPGFGLSAKAQQPLNWLSSWAVTRYDPGRPWKNPSHVSIKAVVCKGKETSSRKTNKPQNLQQNLNETPTSIWATGSWASLWALPFWALWGLRGPRPLLMPCRTRPAIIASAERLHLCLRSWRHWYLNKALTCGLSQVPAHVLRDRVRWKVLLPLRCRGQSIAHRVEKK